MKTWIILIFISLYHLSSHKSTTLISNINKTFTLNKKKSIELDTNKLIRGHIIIIDTNKVQRNLADASVFIYKNQANYKKQNHITITKTNSLGKFAFDFDLQSKEISNPFIIAVQHPDCPIKIFKIFKNCKQPYTFTVYYQLVSQRDLLEKIPIPPNDNPKIKKRKKQIRQ
jgi:hypothetical protein